MVSRISATIPITLLSLIARFLPPDFPARPGNGLRHQVLSAVIYQTEDPVNRIGDIQTHLQDGFERRPSSCCAKNQNAGPAQPPNSDPHANLFLLHQRLSLLPP
jgi:hypothetical protein